EPARAVLHRRARDLGRDLGRSAARDSAATATGDSAATATAATVTGDSAAGDTALRDTVSALEDLGFEPRAEDDAVVLGNCPFHALAQRHTELVCGANLCLLEGLLDGLAAPFTARLAPSPGHCCVRLEP
ncbi:MAG: transcriptional regulator, partial [Saccharothrix sp.]|nr:transcriptional regulator [Saccharothrix sp.]